MLAKIKHWFGIHTWKDMLIPKWSTEVDCEGVASAVAHTDPFKQKCIICGKIKRNIKLTKWQ